MPTSGVIQVCRTERLRHRRKRLLALRRRFDTGRRRTLANSADGYGYPSAVSIRHPHRRWHLRHLARARRDRRSPTWPAWPSLLESRRRARPTRRGTAALSEPQTKRRPTMKQAAKREAEGGGGLAKVSEVACSGTSDGGNQARQSDPEKTRAGLRESVRLGVVTERRFLAVRDLPIFGPTGLPGGKRLFRIHPCPTHNSDNSDSPARLIGVIGR